MNLRFFNKVLQYLKTVPSIDGLVDGEEWVDVPLIIANDPYWYENKDVPTHKEKVEYVDNGLLSKEYGKPEPSIKDDSGNVKAAIAGNKEGLNSVIGECLCNPAYGYHNTRCRLFNNEPIQPKMNSDLSQKHSDNSVECNSKVKPREFWIDASGTDTICCGIYHKAFLRHPMKIDTIHVTEIPKGYKLISRDAIERCFNPCQWVNSETILKLLGFNDE